VVVVTGALVVVSGTGASTPAGVVVDVDGDDRTGIEGFTLVACLLVEVRVGERIVVGFVVVGFVVVVGVVVVGVVVVGIVVVGVVVVVVVGVVVVISIETWAANVEIVETGAGELATVEAAVADESGC